MKAAQPQLGFNNNVKHKGVVFHIQTEDSGIKHPHIITHLFADGGRILKSIKTSYAALVGEPDYVDVVRGMMKEQHKAMIVALREGQFDAGGAREVKLPETGPFAAGSQLVTGAAAAAKVSANATGEIARVVIPDDALGEASAAGRNPPVRVKPLDPIDLNELERAATTAARTQNEPATPPPRPAVKSPSMRPPSMRPPPKPSRPPAMTNSAPPPVGRVSRPPPGKYAATRPASIFAMSKVTAPTPLFGDDLISERSLDEVILSFLAEDLEADAK